MIVGLLILAVCGAIASLLTLLPEFSLPAPVVDVGLLAILGAANRVLPIGAMAGALALALVVLLALSLWDFIVWVYHQFWGSS